MSDLSTLLAATQDVAAKPDDYDHQALADAAAATQDIIAALRKQEADLATALGKREGEGGGELSDGRQFTLKRSSERKEWDHEDWKRDVRREVVARITDHIQIVEDLVDVRTGEVVALGALLHEAVAAAQNVHGSAEPKSTDLKKLGLFKGAYCTTTPGGWLFRAIRQDPTETKDTTDA